MHVEIDEKEIDFEGREHVSKSEIKEELTTAMHEKLNNIDDWCEVYKFIEDNRDKKRKE